MPNTARDIVLRILYINYRDMTSGIQLKKHNMKSHNLTPLLEVT